MRRALRGLVLVATAATSITGLWLGFVITSVLPGQAPASIPMWSAVAFLCFALVALSIACAWDQRPSAAIQTALMVVSLVALGFGLYALQSMLGAPDSRFEGYVLLIGVILAAHGLVGLLFGGSGLRSTRARTAVSG